MPVTGSFKDLSPETWNMIIKFLWQMPDVARYPNDPDRSNQRDLAALMKVSPEFNCLAAPYLYQDVYTDNLESLMYNVLRPKKTLPITSKLFNLRNIKSLHLQYMELDLARVPRWVDEIKQSDIICETNYWAMLAGLNEIERAGGPASVFPSLTTLAYGGQGSLAIEIAFRRNPTFLAVNDMAASLRELARLPSLRYVCQRAFAGPLDVMTRCREDGITAIVNLHNSFNSTDGYHTPGVMGTLFRWFVENPMYGNVAVNWRELPDDVLRRFEYALNPYVWRRRSDQACNIEVYCGSTSAADVEATKLEIDLLRRTVI